MTINQNSNYKECWTRVNRRNFVPDIMKNSWHINSPIKIGFGQTTSQPSLITNMLQIMFKAHSLEFNSGIRVLDIGSGSGIVSALIACIIGKGQENIHKNKNEIIGIDIYPGLIRESKKNVNKINVHWRKDFAEIKFKTLDVYELFKKSEHLGKFDFIYIGAEPKTDEEILEFKTSIPKLLRHGGVAIGPIHEEIHLFKNNKWHTRRIPLRTRFVALKKTRKLSGGSKNNKKTQKKKEDKKEDKKEEEQKNLIKEEKSNRYSFPCENVKGVCNIAAITARSAKLYRNHLFPDFNSKEKLEKWLQDKCIIDIGSGINTVYEDSFIADLTKKNIGIDRVGVDLKDLNKSRKNFKEYARFVKADIKHLSAKDLDLDNACEKKKKIILINNLLYLWIDEPKELKKVFENLLFLLKESPGSQIRIFPVYFGRYDMFNDDLKKFLDSHFKIKLCEPKLTAEGLYEWHNKHNRKIFIKKNSLKHEKQVNIKLVAKTLILTV